MEIDCPSCSEAILIADDELAEGIECPFCQQKIELEKADSEDRNSESTSNDSKQLPPLVDQKTADLILLEELVSGKLERKYLVVLMPTDLQLKMGSLIAKKAMKISLKEVTELVKNHQVFNNQRGY